MPSPFPGMDPYLEPHWPDVHLALVNESRRVLNRQLPGDLVARVDERIVAAESKINAATADPRYERFVRILDVRGQLVTVIEFVSPANKQWPGVRHFRRTREGLLTAGVHFVEIDLVRGGSWRRLMRGRPCSSTAESTFRAIVRVAGQEDGFFYPIPLRRSLPDLPVPLRPGDATVTLPLQALLTAVYDNGRYGRTIDYTWPLDPPPGDVDDALVAEALLRPFR